MRSEPSSLFELLESQAATQPDRAALLAPNRRPLTYEELFALVIKIGGKLNSIGLRRDDRVAIVVENGPEAATAFLTVSSVAGSAPLNPAYTKPEFDFCFSDLKPKALLVHSNIGSTAREAARDREIPICELAPVENAEAGVFDLTVDEDQFNHASEEINHPTADDIALVLHTSGTTSRPKIVALTQHNVIVSARNTQEALKLTVADQCLNVMPLFHIHGLVGCLLSSLAAGSSVVCCPGFRAPDFSDWVDAFDPTWYSAVPTIHQAILDRLATPDQSDTTLPAFRLVRSASSPLAPTLMRDLEEFFLVPAIEAYGMTEGAHQIASNPLPPGIRKAGSVGRAAGPKVAIMNADGSIEPEGVTGEIVISGENVFPGYLANPEANAESFKDGWFRTGDEGYIDAEGYLFIKGRIKEIINRGGEKISPREVDEALLEHPEIIKAVTFGFPDARLGEEVAAAVVLRKEKSISRREIQEYLKVRIASFKVPRRIVFAESIPTGPSGKIQRRRLAQSFGLAMSSTENTAPLEHVPPRNDAERQVAKFWKEILRIERVGTNESFFALGGDSLLAARLLTRMEEEFGTDHSLFEFSEKPTIEAMALALSQELNRRKQ